MFYLQAFSNLSYYNMSNRDDKEFHQYIKEDKKYLYIPDRRRTEFTWMNCTNIAGCQSYSYSTSSIPFLFNKEEKVNSLLKYFIFGSETYKPIPTTALSILDQMLTIQLNCCIDYKAAKVIYDELLPFESLSKYDFIRSNYFCFIINVSF